MFIVQKKNQYAIRALFELGKHWGKGPVKISEIAKAQAIPPRFLEVILSQLKGSGLVTSKRGFYGGYSLVPPPDQVTVGALLRFMEGDDIVLDCMNCDPGKECPFDNKCAFLPMWRKVKTAIFKIYDETSLQDLMENEVKASLM
ncbi:MAG: Rrf2 family transcriptional regulator [Desulfobacterales bacterium]|nr:Rrf2 family transcriptional regulator [Desulfobacterales bacterium]